MRWRRWCVTVASRETDAVPAPFAARAPRRVVLGDGARWIWMWADEHAPGTIQTVGIWHAKEGRQGRQRRPRQHAELRQEPVNDVSAVDIAGVSVPRPQTQVDH